MYITIEHKSKWTGVTLTELDNNNFKSHEYLF